LEIKKIVRKILRDLGCLNNCEISIVFLSDEEIRVLNKDYLGRDKPTNVISFPMKGNQDFNINPEILGDIVISLDRARIEVEDNSMTLQDVIIFYLIHGILHLLGYTHGTEMHRKESFLSKSLGDKWKEKKKVDLIYF